MKVAKSEANEETKAASKSEAKPKAGSKLSLKKTAPDPKIRTIQSFFGAGKPKAAASNATMNSVIEESLPSVSTSDDEFPADAALPSASPTKS